MSNEVWRPVVGNEAYAVSDHGRVKRAVTSPGATAGRILKPQKINAGYLQVRLYSGTRESSRWERVHVLVAEAFVPNPHNKPQVNHIDGDKTNNKSANLQWVTASENVQHAYSAGIRTASVKGDDHPWSKLTEQDVQAIREARASGVNRRILAEKYGVGMRQISRITNRTRWGHV